MSQVICIDGYTGTGKGTTATRVAERLGWLYVDTGAMRRAVTYVAERDGWRMDTTDEEKASSMKRYKLSFYKNPDTGHDDMRVDDENIESHIRSTQLGMLMKPIVTCIPLRVYMQELMRRFADAGPLVADGRDMGTVVFPDAQWKFFLTCDLEKRTERRYIQLLNQGKNPNKELIYSEIQQRDETDYLGLNAVNKKADDAIVIDTSDCSIEEQVDKIYKLVKGL